MREKSPALLLLSVLLPALTAISGVEPMKTAAETNNRHYDRNEPQEVNFTLVRQPENTKQYILAISDDNERNISGSFSIDQLQILRAIMVAADKFAISGEAVGTKEPITTRFMDKQEPAFVIDVQKDANQSLLFLTLKTEIGRMTWSAGRIIRSTRREEGFFFELLSRLESTLPKLPNQPSK